MDMAIIKGKISREPEFIKNGGEIRCQMNVVAEITEKKGVALETTYVHVLATTEPALADKCKAFLEKDDEIVLVGEFGFHKGRLKMRVKDINLPDVQIVA